jgi:hypothetical protein
MSMGALTFLKRMGVGDSLRGWVKSPGLSFGAEGGKSFSYNPADLAQ